MKKALLLFLFCSPMISFSQVEDPVYFGGNLGFSFSNVGSSFNITPQVGYKITEEFSVGTGFTYQRNSFKNNINNQKNSYSIFGGSLFARYIASEFIVIQTEYEVLSFPRAYNPYDVNSDGRALSKALFIGGGVRYPLSDNASLMLLALYNVLERPNKFTPYQSNPIVRAGFYIGI